ncbi:MAG: hypothetical protein GY774_00585 [Planctomycetes bacterium]|nr:hypothetical protein [Planctomycetota bacterium]
MNNTLKESKRLANVLGILQLFIGLGAVGGGLGLVLEPSGANLGMPLEMLNHSPFSDFLIPGIVLLIVNGLGSIAGSVLSFKLFQYAAEIALALGAFLVAWILIQVYWIHTFHWLHALYLSLGIIELALGWLLRKALRAS